jgi:hypothetical protein
VWLADDRCRAQRRAVRAFFAADLQVVRVTLAGRPLAARDAGAQCGHRQRRHEGESAAYCPCLPHFALL